MIALVLLVLAAVCEFVAAAAAFGWGGLSANVAGWTALGLGLAFVAFLFAAPWPRYFK